MRHQHYGLVVPVRLNVQSTDPAPPSPYIKCQESPTLPYITVCPLTLCCRGQSWEAESAGYGGGPEEGWSPLNAETRGGAAAAQRGNRLCRRSSVHFSIAETMWGGVETKGVPQLQERCEGPYEMAWRATCALNIQLFVS